MTTTPLQALSLLNNPFVHRVADRFAERVAGEAQGTALGTARAQVRHAWRLALGREPEPDEEQLALQVLESHGLATVCRALFNSSEFVVID